MGNVIIEIPETFARSFGATDEEAAQNARTGLAVAMYREGNWSAKRAADFCGLNRLQFMNVLRDREVEMPYTKEMIEEDLAHAHRRR